ncbi:hypothetical protein BH11PAT4_BH11PAT4_6500 [soil metagenome]
MKQNAPQHKTERSYIDLSLAQQKAMIEAAAKDASKMKRDLIERYNKKMATGK